MGRNGTHPYLPMTEDERKKALYAAGLKEGELFSSIPDELRLKRPLDLPAASGELELTREFHALMSRNTTTAQAISFLGGGVYDHFVPAAVDAIASRGEFVTAYTPYQAEASQGSLAAFFEFQTMIVQLTGMEVANAGVYDGATATAESVLMARRLTKGRGGAVVVSAAVHPEYVEVLRTYLQWNGIEMRLAPADNGATDCGQLERLAKGSFAAVVANPNVYGSVEDLAGLFAAAKREGALCIAVANPITLGVLEAPGAFGADIVCGDGQPLGCYQNFGGPSFGFMAARRKDVRQLPGRLVGETTDAEGRRGFCLTLQTREQHIRRERATSNICTNHALMTIRATVYMALLGPRGLAEVARQCAAKAHYAAAKIAALPGYRLTYGAPFFHEFVVTCPRPASDVAAQAALEGIFPGVPLSRLWPERTGELLIAVTEKRTREDIDRLVGALGRIGGVR